MMHVCNRENCPPTNIAGPKTHCIKCKKLCYLLCFGAEKSSTGLVRFKLPNQLTIFVDVTNSQFACTGCLIEGNVVVQTTMQLMQKTIAGGTTGEVNDGVTNSQLMDVLKAGFVDLKDQIQSNIVKVDKSAHETKNSMVELMKKIEETSKSNAMPTGSTNRQLYSSVLKSKKKVLFTGNHSTQSTPISSKRKRQDNSDIDLIDLSVTGNKTIKPEMRIPKPKMGTKDVVIGQKPKPWEPRASKRLIKTNRFMKSVRVAGLDPSVTVDQLSEYITNNTTITDSSRFECKMLVKKDQDLKALTYVSYKVDVSADDFDLLMNLEVWPNYVTVREFVQMNKRNREKMSVDEQVQPNKSQRIDNDSSIVNQALNSSKEANAELGFH